MIWLQFVGAATAVLLAGYFIVRFADDIAKQTGLGRVWAGVLLLATATSLPELATGLGAIRLVGEPDLAAGGVFGSNVFNLMLIAALALRPAWRGLLFAPSAELLRLATISVGLIVLAVAILLLARPSLDVPAPLLTWLPISLLLAYFIATLWMFRQPGSVPPTAPARTTLDMSQGETADRNAIWRPIAGYLAGATIVVVAGVWMSDIADEIATQLDWSHSFVGSLFLAATTSLPEVAVAVAALRAGMPQMALSNLVGSNMFNVGIVLPVEALSQVSSPMFREVSTFHLISAVAAISMTGLMVWRGLPERAEAAMLARRGYHRWSITMRAVAMIGLFLISQILVFAFA